MDCTRLSCALLVAFAVAFAAPVRAADERPVAPRGGAVDYPLGLVALASLDRVQARAESLAEAMGMSGEGHKLLVGLLGGDDDVQKLLETPGLDASKPIGAMSYPNWFSLLGEGGAPKFDDNLLEDPLNLLVESFVEGATVVICIPVKDRQALLGTVRELIGEGKELNEIPGKPGWYSASDDKDVQLGFVGSYLYIVADDGEVKNFDRNFPEFDKLAKGSLGKNGFVYAVYRRGLPAIVRDVMAPALKMAFAARFQQQDEESEIEFRLRTMLGPLQLDLFDLLVSHVEEFRITGHVDSTTRQLSIESEVVGPKDGKLAKYCNGLKIKTSPFAGLTTDEALLALTASFPLPAKTWKPVVEAVYAQADRLGKSDPADVIRTLAKTVEAGQLDVYSHNPTWEEGLFAVRVSGNAQFPEQFQQMLETASDSPLFELAVESVEGIPIHRSRTTVDMNPGLMLTMALYQWLIGEGPDFPSLNEPATEVEYQIERMREVVREDGTKEVVPEVTKGTRPAAKNSAWLAATPHAIWLGFGGTATGDCPEWFKSQIAASLAKPATIASRNKSAFRLTVRGLGASPNADDIQQVANSDETPDEERERGDVLRDFPNAITIDVSPTETGAKLSLSFDEAYFQWFATYAKQEAFPKKNQAVGPTEAVPVPAN